MPATESQEGNWAPLADDVALLRQTSATTAPATPGVWKEGGASSCISSAKTPPKSIPAYVAPENGATEAALIPAAAAPPAALKSYDDESRPTVDPLLAELTRRLEADLENLLAAAGVNLGVRTKARDQLQQVSDAHVELVRQREENATIYWLGLLDSEHQRLEQLQQHQRWPGGSLPRTNTSVMSVVNNLCQVWQGRKSGHHAECNQGWPMLLLSSEESVSRLLVALEAIGSALDTRHNAEVTSLKSELLEVTASLENQGKKLFATEKTLTKARARAAVLAEDLRNRGGTKDYSTLAVKLGVAEAEIRSLTARKMQLAVKLSHVEREREQALQAFAEAELHERQGKALANTTTTSGRHDPRHPWRKHSQQQQQPNNRGAAEQAEEHFPHANKPSQSFGGLPAEENEAVVGVNGRVNESTTRTVRRERKDGENGAVSTALGSTAATTPPPPAAARIEEQNDGNSVGVGRRENRKQSFGEEETDDSSSSGEVVVERFSNGGDLHTSPNKHRQQAFRDESEPVGEREDGRENGGGKSASSVEEAVRDLPRLGLPASEGGFGGSAAVWKRGGRERVVLTAAVEKARASERRCVALLAASSQKLDAERKESERLRQALLLIEGNKVSYDDGGSSAQTDNNQWETATVEHCGAHGDPGEKRTRRRRDYGRRRNQAPPLLVHRLNGQGSRSSATLKGGFGAFFQLLRGELDAGGDDGAAVKRVYFSGVAVVLVVGFAGGVVVGALVA